MMMKNIDTKKLIAILIATSVCIPTAFTHAAEDHAAHATENLHDHGDSTHDHGDSPHDHDDNPVLTKITLDKFELRNDDDVNPLVMEAQAWIGTDLNKFWLKTEFEKRDGEFEEAEVQALYSRAIAPYWDLQMGIRQDIKPSPTRTWGVLGVQGLAPYFFEVDTALFVGESGKTALRIAAEYELLFTQTLILSPEIDVNLYGQDDWETGVGSGLSDLTTGLRLRYEIKRELAPYIGVEWNKKMGDTANIAKHKGETDSDASVVAGLRIWF